MAFLIKISNGILLYFSDKLFREEVLLFLARVLLKVRYYCIFCLFFKAKNETLSIRKTARKLFSYLLIFPEIGCNSHVEEDHENGRNSCGHYQTEPKRVEFHVSLVFSEARVFKSVQFAVFFEFRLEFKKPRCVHNDGDEQNSENVVAGFSYNQSVSVLCATNSQKSFQSNSQASVRRSYGRLKKKQCNKLTMTRQVK